MGSTQSTWGLISRVSSRTYRKTNNFSSLFTNMFSRALQFTARRTLSSNHCGGKYAKHFNNGPYFLRTNPVWQCTLGRVMPGKSIPHSIKTAILLSLIPQTAVYYAILMEEDAINKFLGTEALSLTTGCFSIGVGMFAWFFCAMAGFAW